MRERAAQSSALLLLCDGAETRHRCTVPGSVSPSRPLRSALLSPPPSLAARVQNRSKRKNVIAVRYTRVPTFFPDAQSAFRASSVVKLQYHYLVRFATPLPAAPSLASHTKTRSASLYLGDWRGPLLVLMRTHPGPEVDILLEQVFGRALSDAKGLSTKVHLVLSGPCARCSSDPSLVREKSLYGPQTAGGDCLQDFFVHLWSRGPGGEYTSPGGTAENRRGVFASKQFFETRTICGKSRRSL